ncbi:MAG: hypothetical protein ACK4OI_19605, partial [Rhizobium oryzihabitans]
AKLEKEEIIPVIPPVPDTDLNEYFSLIERRFLNPKIGDTIPRLAQDGSNRQPKFILPSTADRLERDLPPGASLFDAHPFTVVSLDYIKSERRREAFQRFCPEFVIV